MTQGLADGRAAASARGMAYTDDDVREAVERVLTAGGLPRITAAGHPVLRARALPFTGQFDAGRLAALIELMRRTMLDAPGVGLAAPQIGIPLQLAVLEDLYQVDSDTAAVRDRQPLDFFAILNPRYTPVGAETASFYEGCLSVPGWQAVVDRHAAVELAYDDENGTARTRRFQGWQARIVQHETDHLHGTLYIDKAHPRSLAANEEYAAHWAASGIERARAGLGF